MAYVQLIQPKKKKKGKKQKAAPRVLVYAKAEDRTISNSVSAYPVEKGYPVGANAKQDSNEFVIDGQIICKTAGQANAIFKKLETWANRGDLVKFQGAQKLSNLVIAELTRHHQEFKLNTIEFTMTVQKISIAKPYKRTKKKGKKQKKAGKKKKTGTFVTVKAGNTYWGWMTKYGTSLKQLRAWNKWPDRKIPIGKRARVK